MTQTSLGFPLFDLTDDANIANKLNAISNALNTFLTPARQNMVQTAGIAPIVSATITTVYGWSDVDASTGMGAYSAGIRTIARDGVYQVNAQITYLPVASATGQRQCRFHLNGTAVAYSLATPSSTQDVSTGVAWTGILHAGDQVLVAAYQSQGSAVGLQTAAGANTWQIARLGPI